MKDIFRKIITERVFCHLVKYGVFLTIALLVYNGLVSRLPERLDSLTVSVPSGSLKVESDTPLSQSKSISYPELENRVKEIAGFVHDSDFRSIAFLLFNSSGEYPQTQTVTLHQICSAVKTVEQQSTRLSKCSLKELSDTDEALSKLHRLYILDRFHWGNDPLRLQRYRLSQLGYDLVDVFQHDLINQGEFTKTDRDNFDLRTNSRIEKLKEFQTY